MVRFLMVGISTLAIVPAAFAAFPDVGSDHWAYDAVAKVQQLGLMTARSDGQFHGDRAPTRYEMALALARVMAEVDNRLIAKTSNPDELVPYVERINLVVADEIDKLKQSQREVRAEVKAVEDRVCTLGHACAGAPAAASEAAPSAAPAAPSTVGKGKPFIEGALQHADHSAPIVAATPIQVQEALAALQEARTPSAGGTSPATAQAVSVPAPSTAAAVAGSGPVGVGDPSYAGPSEGERDSILAAPTSPDPYPLDVAPKPQPVERAKRVHTGAHHGIVAAIPTGKKAAAKRADTPARAVPPTPEAGKAVTTSAESSTSASVPAAAPVPVVATVPIADKPSSAGTAAGDATLTAAASDVKGAGRASTRTASAPEPEAASDAAGSAGSTDSGGGATGDGDDEKAANTKPMTSEEALKWLQLSPSAKALIEKLRAEHPQIH